MESYPGERAIVDGSNVPDGGAVLTISGSDYWEIKHVDFENSSAPTEWAMMGIVFYGNGQYNLLEDIDVSYMDGPGVGVYDQSNNNTFVNIRTHHNYDISSNGGNSDGFQIAGGSITSTVPTGNIIRDSFSWNNGDDGYDLWQSYRNEIHNTKAWHNGYKQDGITIAGDGVGFKLGRGLGGHTVTHSAAWDNRLYGFDQNTSTGVIKVYNNTAYNNRFGFAIPNAVGAEVKNNIAYGNTDGNVSNWSGASDNNLGSFNTWNLGTANPQFLSTNPSDPDFLRLSASSPVRDAGTNVGYSGSDTFPDLGAYAYVPMVDTTAPSAPSGLSALAVSSIQINLSWTASTDTGGSGLKGYRVERCEGSGCSNFVQIATPMGTTYNDMSGLAGSTIYRYRVRAEDNATPPNFSGYSSIVNATTESGVADITTGLVSHWTFDNTANDVSGNGNHGTLMGGPLYTTGKLGQALNFNHSGDLTDNTKVVVPASSSLNDLGQISISAWIYPRSAGEGVQGTVVAKELSAGSNTGWTIDMGNSPVNRVRFLMDYSGTNLAKTTPEGSLLYNEWQHVMVTWNGSSAASDVNIYIDGVLQATGSGSTDATGTRVFDAAIDLGIGGLAQNNIRDFDGLIDDVRIYNRPLSGLDVNALYALGNSPTPTPPSGSTACHSLDNADPISSGYGASFNPFTVQKELLLSVMCDGSAKTVTLGNGNMGNASNWDGRMWVWNQGHELVSNAWQPVTYTCSGEQVPATGGAWCRATATGTLNATATAYLGYTCQWHAGSGSYKCGCTDSSCSTPRWHVQGIQP